LLVSLTDKKYIVVLLFVCITTNRWGMLLVAHLVEALRYKSEGRVFDS
jgi:general stress protein CsbA